MIKIEVTEEDIKNGVRESAQQCPIAQALLRQLDFAQDIDVFDDGMLGVNFLGPLGYEAMYQSPKKAVRFIQRFDEGKPVKPFSFVLRES